jgi:hypothetical protein
MACRVVVACRRLLEEGLSPAAARFVEELARARELRDADRDMVRAVVSDSLARVVRGPPSNTADRPERNRTAGRQLTTSKGARSVTTVLDGATSAALDRAAAQHGLSRAELVRLALRSYLAISEQNEA